MNENDGRSNVYRNLTQLIIAVCIYTFRHIQTIVRMYSLCQLRIFSTEFIAASFDVTCTMERTHENVWHIGSDCQLFGHRSLYIGFYRIVVRRYSRRSRCRCTMNKKTTTIKPNNNQCICRYMLSFSRHIGCRRYYTAALFTY